MMNRLSRRKSSGSLISFFLVLIAPLLVGSFSSPVRPKKLQAPVAYASIRRQLGARAGLPLEAHQHGGDEPWDEAYIAQKQRGVPAVQVVEQMPEPLPGGTMLSNKYYLLRHGLSTANVAEVISSDRATLAYTTQHGLTETGYEQGKAAAVQLLNALDTSPKPKKNETVVFVSSPFARARQTAYACLDGLKDLDTSHLTIQPRVVLNDFLVERYFGRLDGEAIYTYAYVWPLDKFNVTHTAFEVESVAAVCWRLRELVNELEEQYQNTHIVLVSHADVLQICQLYAAQAPNVGEFSSFRFKNGEVRAMLTASMDHLPEPSPLEKPDRSTRQG